MKVEERLLKYVSYWTTSDESCSDIPSSEREFTLAKALKQELETLLVDYEREHLQVQSGVLRSEAQGNWLQRSWRPVIMLAFTVVILVGMFTDLPMPEDTSRFWDLLEIGLGGYIVGRFRMRK